MRKNSCKSFEISASATLKIIRKISTKKQKKMQQFYSQVCNIQILDVDYVTRSRK